MPAVAEPIQNTFFQSLRQRFPTWAELKAHLESADGGALRVIETSESPYAVIRYVKGKSRMGEAELGVGQFRSVVWDTTENRPLCVAPVKATEGMPPLNVQLSAVEDFVDGFMMNAFVRKGGDIMVATRTAIGGANTFYGEKSFGDMFLDSLRSSPLKSVGGLQSAMEVALTEGVESVFASFVVQHPQHRVVARATVPICYCVLFGLTYTDGTVELMEQPAQWPVGLVRLQVPSYPLRQFRTEQEVTDLLRKTGVQRGWRWQGLVFKDGTGARWRLRTDTYTMMRELRGSEAAPVDRFLRLREQGRMKEYLQHYSEERNAFWAFEQTLRARTMDLLRAYSDCHKAHAVAFKDLPEAYRPGVYLLHLEWREKLRAAGYKVRLQNAIKVVNAMRDFERKRLMEAEAYVPVSGAPPTEEEGAEEGTTQEEEQTAAEAVAETA